MTDQPQGWTCPGCGSPAMFANVLPAFCPNDACHVMSWNPDQSLEQLVDGATTLDLSALSDRFRPEERDR